MGVENTFHRITLELMQGEIDAGAPEVLDRIPHLDEGFLEDLDARIEKASLSEPKYGWALATAVDAAAVRSGRQDWEAKAAFHLAQAANHLTRPGLVSAAAGRAGRRFTDLGMPGWAAAAEWQRYEQPWMWADFRAAAQRLESTVRTMRSAGPERFIPHALRSLAYAQILRWEYAAAEESLAAAEEAFLAMGDEVNLARCRLHRASMLRRLGDYEGALASLEQCRNVFSKLNARVEFARVDYQVATLHLFWKTDLQSAKTLYERAGNIFAGADIPLWNALCDNGLAQVYNKSGELGPALEHLQRARTEYARHGVLGSLADNLVDTAQLEMASGQYREAVEKNREAEALYKQVGSPGMAYVARMYRGEALAQTGRYQAALRHLEIAWNGLSEIDRPDRLAECGVLLAQVWLRLNRPEMAQPYLEKALDRYRETENGSYLSLVYAYLARTAALEKDFNRSKDYLEDGLHVAERAGLEPLVAFSHRLLGETHLSTGEPELAVRHLGEAADRFRALDMPAEEAFCRAQLGHGLLALSAPERGRRELETALDLGLDGIPEIAWLSHAGLAEIASGRGRAGEALAHWERMARALSLLRLGFTQPALYKDYHDDRRVYLDRAVSYAVRNGRPSTCLALIEDNKALILARAIAGGSRPPRRPSPELDALREEIVWKKSRLENRRAAGENVLRTAGDRRKLAGLFESYDRLFSSLERQGIDPGGSPAEGRFSPDLFHELAEEACGAGWMALDFYESGDEIVCVVVESDRSAVFRTGVSGRLGLLLEFCRKAHLAGYSLGGTDLEVLAAGLVPPDAAARLAPESILLISPHGRLHAVPWPALRLQTGEGETRYLVEQCIPVLTPSLHGFTVLQRRERRSFSGDRRGLLVAAGSFHGRHPDLPQVEAESRAMQTLFADEIEIRLDDAATWDGLLKSARREGIGDYAFLHLATHAFHDPLTARLSGFALHDRDVWLEDLWDLAPLPPLVTLSACSGTRSLVFAGDEPDGLAATCLAAGAATVIGSLWPVLDSVSAQRTEDLYTALQSGAGPASALAAAQRTAILRGESPDLWGGYLCLGSGF
jgi:tetratricopeptide (TPR) repeat protein